MKKTYMLGAVFVALLLGSVVSTASAGTNYFLQVDKIPGESTDWAHKNWIEVISFSHEISGSASTTGRGRAGGRAQVGPLVIVKEIDKATPKLYVNCCMGKAIPNVVLSVCQTGGSKREFLKLTLGDAVISSIVASSDASGNPVEEVSLGFGSIQWDYTEIDSSGKVKGIVSGGWNVTKNKSL